MEISYSPRGVCSRRIDIETQDGVILRVNFHGGCDGNLQGISKLVAGMTVKDAAEKLKGIRCGFKSTSCPDQLATALESIISRQTKS